MMKQYIVFDLDGTLVDSLPGIAEGVNRSLKLLGRPPHTEEQVRGMIGRGAAHLCAAALGYADASLAPKPELDAMSAHFRREYPSCWQGVYTTPYSGMRRLLRDLVAAGARLAVLSNKPHDVTLPMVKELFPEVPFSPIMGFTGEFPRKPAPEAFFYIAGLWGVPTREMTLVGDSQYDAQTARNAGADLLLVDWGYSRNCDLRSFGAPVCHHADELRDLLLNR